MGWHAPPEDLALSNPLWDMALELWSRPGFAEACLEAQAEGIVVSHILVALYSARTGFVWNGSEPDDILAWRRGATETFRAFRRQLAKDNPAVATLRRQVAECELGSEQVELAWWWHFLGTMDLWAARADLHPADRARHNLEAIGMTDRLDSIRDRIITAWTQGPVQNQPTENPR